MHLLLIEDNPVETRLIQAILARAKGAPVRLDCAANLAGGLDKLSKESYDAVLLDLLLPDSEGLDTFLKVQAQAPGVPVVVLTVSDDEALASRALQAGAQDYLFKGQVDSNLLVRSVRYAIERQRLRTEREQYARHLSKHFQLLRHGFARLASGDVDVRISNTAGVAETNDELSDLLTGFDWTCERLGELRNMKAQFFSMITHDLRSPLSTVALAVNALENPRSTEKDLPQFLDIIKRKTTHVIGLVDELLEVFFIESGHLKLVTSTVDINELLRAVVNDLSQLAAARHQDLRLETLEGDSALSCDSTKIYRVLENLVSNAIKYSVESDRIEVRAAPSNHGAVRFEVHDHGPGIDPADRKKLFEPFYRGTQAQARVQGSGLGLGICKSFVEAHGGRIWVEGQSGSGTSFCFELPRQFVQ